MECKFIDRLSWESENGVECPNGNCETCGFNPKVAEDRLYKKYPKEAVNKAISKSKERSWLK